MFNSISWQDFLYAICVIVGGYYIIAALLLYSSEIASFFKRNKSKQSEQDSPEDQIKPNDSNDLLGEVKYNTGVNVPHENIVESSDIESQELKVAEDAIDNVIVNTPDALIKKEVAELILQIKTLLQEFSAESRDDITSVFQPLLQNFPTLIGTSYQDEVSLFIHSSLSANTKYGFTPEEVKSWWQNETSQS